MAKLPLYEILPGTTGSGVQFVSLVQSPAIEIGWFAFETDARFHPNCRCRILDSGVVKLAKGACDVCREAKQAYDEARKRGKRLPRGIQWVSPDDLAFKAVDAEKRMIAGPIMVPDQAIYRKDPDGKEYEVFFTAATIETYVKRFFRERRTTAVNEEHTDVMAPVYIVESWIVEDPKMDKSATMGFSLPKGTWFGTMHVEDEAYWDEMVKSGRVRGFSVEGTMAVSTTTTEMTDNKFSVALDNGTVIANTDDTDTFEVGQDLWVILESGEKVPAEDGQYALPDDQGIIDAVGGKIVAVRPVEEMAAEAVPASAEFDALKAEMTATLADLAARIGALEASAAEAKTAMEAQKATIDEQAETIKKFTANTPGAKSITVKASKAAPAAPAKPEGKHKITLAALEAMETYIKSR